MKSKTNTFQLALAGMLIAIGIVIPMFSPPWPAMSRSLSRCSSPP